MRVEVSIIKAMTETIAPIQEGGPTVPVQVKSPQVRALGLPGVLIFTASGIGVCYTGWNYFSTVPGLFPGSSLIGICLVMLAGAALLSVVYSVIGTLAPYYGADFRFSSRVLGAPLAFASSFSFVVLFSLVSGAIIAAIFTSTVPSFLKIMGTVFFEKTLFNQAQVVSDPYAVTLSGTSLLLLIFLFLLLPPKVTHRVLLVGTLLALLAWVLIFCQLGTANPSGFPAGWDRFLGEGNFFQHLGDARQLGMRSDMTRISVFALGMLLALALFSGVLSSVNIAAEVKQPHKNFLRGNLAALIAGVAVILIAVVLLRRLVPDEWISAESFLAQRSGATSPAMPWIAYYGAVLMPNPGIAWLVGVFWMFSMLNLAHTFLYSASRVILAWVEDRILPKRLGFIHPGSKSPLISILAVCILAEFGMVSAVLNQNLFTPLALVFVVEAVLVIPVFAVILFPFRRKTWLQAAPGWMRSRIGPLPLVSLIGAIALACLLGADSQVMTSAGESLPAIPVLAVCLIAFFTGLVWYYGRRSALLAQGENIDSIFEQMPE
jgi:basic amino acid/polyamine antiporter, APA family